MDFTPINTQEEFDAAIKDRISRERAKFADYDAVKKENETLKKSLETLTGEKQSWEKTLQEEREKSSKLELEGLRTKVAVECGIPLELKGRLNGSNEEELRKDAELVKKYVGTRKAPPLGSTEEGGSGGKKKDLEKILKELRGE